jgi:hypothetical protein
LEEIRNSDRSYIVDPENPPEGFRSINWAINAEAFLAAVMSVATDYQKPLEKRETARFLPHLAGMMIPRETNSRTHCNRRVIKEMKELPIE